MSQEQGASPDRSTEAATEGLAEADPAAPADAATARAEEDQPAEALPGAEAVELEAAPLELFFTAHALRYSSHVNLLRGGEIAFHMKYVAMRGGFVMNDMQGGAWGREIFVEALTPPGAAGLLVTLALEDGEPNLRFPSGLGQGLGDRFRLSGPLRLSAADVVQTGAAARLAAEPRGGIPPLVRMAESAAAANLTVACDVAIISPAGFFVEGWVDDRQAPIAGFSAADAAVGGRAEMPVYRARRQDVEEIFKPGRPWEFGFWTAGIATERTRLQELSLALVTQDGTGVPLELGNQRRMGTAEFFEFLLAHFGRRPLVENRVARSFADLEAGHGKLLAQLHRQMAATRALQLRARFGARPRSPKISLVCVLYGIPDFLYLSVSEFARFGPLDDVEFVFVSNSPELAEVLVRDAELASFVFGAEIAVVVLNQNCGFSYANNIGVAEARSRRIAIINPDVFPREASAFAHMLRLAEDGFGRDVVGGKLYYSDGSVMHEGMFFAPDRKLSALCRAPVWTVEHFRKGFADTASGEVRPVPALTGALMLLERKTFESMGGFDSDFIYGHYEDADLCLRIRQAGGRALLDPRLAYWHYEGAGSVKRPEHAGSNLFNRWSFSRRWGDQLEGANDV